MKISCPHCGATARPVTRGQTIGSVLGITSGGILALLGTVRETSGYGPVERVATIILGVYWGRLPSAASPVRGSAS